MSECATEFSGPITSLLFIANPCNPSTRLLLVGSGTFLSIFSLTPSTRISEGYGQPKVHHKVLAHDRIHHIKFPEDTNTRKACDQLSSTTFLCAGGRELVICSIEKPVQAHAQDSETQNPSSVVFNKIKTLSINDWIIDINCWELSPHGHLQIAVLTAHSQLMIYELEAREHLREVSSVACQDTTLLLSGQIRVREQGRTFVYSIAGGSISGNVTLWEWIANNQTGAIQQVKANLIGHRGAIYDLAFSPLGQKLCTASEDRTVCVWDLNDLTASPLVLWGHLGRVWRVHWWNDQQLTSVGEDCRALTWKLSAFRTSGALEDELGSGTSHKPFSIRQLAHDGRSVWSVTHDEETGYLLTGGADGNISSTLIEPKNTPYIICEVHLFTYATPQEIYMPEHVECYPSFFFYCLAKAITSINPIVIKTLPRTNRNLIKAFDSCWNGCNILYVYQDGSIYARSLFDSNGPEILIYHHPSILRSECHVRFQPGSHAIAYVATNEGYLVSLHDITEPEPSTQIHKFETTITMFTVSLTSNLVSGLIYDCKRNICLLYELFRYSDPKLLFRMCLPPSTIPTCLKLLETKNYKRLFVFVGDADGGLAVGEVSRDEFVTGYVDSKLKKNLNSHIGPIVPLHADGIMDIKIDEDHSSNCFKNCLSLSTLGRDGGLIKCFIEIVNNEIKVLQIHQNPISKGSLELFMTYPPSSRHVGGFEKSCWKIFDRQTGSLISSCKVACNGRPNSWSCRNYGSQGFLFYQQQGSIMIEKFPLPDKSDPILFMPNLGTHGREINCLKALFNFGGMVEIVATGSENGVLEITLNQPGIHSQPLVKVYRNAKIPFTIKCLAWLQNPAQSGVTQRLGNSCQRETQFLVISGSREMFQIFEVTLDRPHDASSIHEMDVGVVQWSSFSQRSAEESEVRIMDLDRLYLGNSTWLLSASQSDGNIRIWTLDPTKKQQRLLCQYKTSCCIFCNRILQIDVLGKREILTLAGMADGTVCVFTLPEIDITAVNYGQVLELRSMEILLKLPHHQSGVGCVKSYSDKNRVIMATGGDDNSLVVECLEFSRNTSTGLLEAETRMIKQPNAHASCISDVYLVGVNSMDQKLGVGKEDRMLLLSVSSDQKLKIWWIDSMFEFDKTPRINLNKIFHTDVADCTSIEVAHIRGRSDDELISQQQTSTSERSNQASHNLCIFLAGIGIERRSLSPFSS
ncbi:hypothetical protein Pst134EB_025086 [Puccinia striiformis f. sp. tritici]|nr:hypothetical protein Pst134EB_025086 [Puccinia striiformis f. sp. tritici]